MTRRARAQLRPADIAADSRAMLNESHGRELHLALRRKLWSAFIATLNSSGLPYCIVGAPEHVADVAGSDVDFVVPPCYYSSVPQLLALAAASVGGRLVQAIEHETTATYFVIALEQHGHLAFLHPDCTTDYRRNGRLWLSSEELLHQRHRGTGGYFRAAPDIDFKYYLAKQVLKQTVTANQWEKLITLYQAAGDPGQAFSWWRLGDAAKIEQTLLHNDYELFRKLAPSLRTELMGSQLRESLVARVSSVAANAVRIARRLARPTGLFVHIDNGSTAQRTELARSLAKVLAPVCRRVSVISYATLPKVLRNLVESTLVVSSDDETAFRRLLGGVNIHWQPALTRSENLEYAVSNVLSYLSQRTRERLNLNVTPSQQFELDTLAPTSIS